ncbi:MAG: cytochrome ubiquinol oxidase subunit I [Candidatus Adiutrix sp.]|jgi:cytochrome d ubiquinol oxidase subunit I|nr:cytochrome ubiquinol oxidase subunit I [Candidatus Adiutrix sp.]
MDPVILSRLQFALATFFHFIYVPLTLGLAPFIAIMETRYVRTGDEMYKRQAQFWGRIFLINFALGVATGLTLEFQFGTNWAHYSQYVGDIFGSLLAIEATAAFFLESTFVAVWAFGWDRVPKKIHLLAIWLVAAASLLSALWILLANGFMQHPVGYAHGEGGRLVLDNFKEVVTNTYGWHMYFHTVFSSLLLAGFLVMGVSAWRLFRADNPGFFHASFKLGATFAFIFSLATIVAGHQLGQVTAKHQPAKLAAMESQWETKDGAPLNLLVIPAFGDDEENFYEGLPIPGLASFLATGDSQATVKGLKAFPAQDRPPVWPVFLSFRVMGALGFIFVGASFLAMLLRGLAPDLRWLLLGFVALIPLPYLAIQLGWLVTELGRQPWVVYNLMRTSLAGSAGVDWFQVAGSLAVMAVIYTVLTLAGLFFMGKCALSDPKTAPAGH